MDKTPLDILKGMSETTEKVVQPPTGQVPVANPEPPKKEGTDNGQSNNHT